MYQPSKHMMPSKITLTDVFSYHKLLKGYYCICVCIVVESDLSSCFMLFEMTSIQYLHLFATNHACIYLFIFSSCYLEITSLLLRYLV